MHIMPVSTYLHPQFFQFYSYCYPWVTEDSYRIERMEDVTDMVKDVELKILFLNYLDCLEIFYIPLICIKCTVQSWINYFT